jgi:hypothetical protein
VLKRCLILPEEAAHAVELLDAPSVTVRNTCGEKAFSAIKQTLERIRLRPLICFQRG